MATSAGEPPASRRTSCDNGGPTSLPPAATAAPAAPPAEARLSRPTSGAGEGAAGRHEDSAYPGRGADPSSACCSKARACSLHPPRRRPWRRQAAVAVAPSRPWNPAVTARAQTAATGRAQPVRQQPEEPAEEAPHNEPASGPSRHNHRAAGQPPAPRSARRVAAVRPRGRRRRRAAAPRRRTPTAQRGATLRLRTPAQQGPCQRERRLKSRLLASRRRLEADAERSSSLKRPDGWWPRSSSVRRWSPPSRCLANHDKMPPLRRRCLLV